jgi:hypothetical protein
MYSDSEAGPIIGEGYGTKHNDNAREDVGGHTSNHSNPLFGGLDPMAILKVILDDPNKGIQCGVRYIVKYVVN